MQSIELKLEKQDFRTKEAFKTLRTNIEFSGENIRVICVTSCTPNEGKSSVSCRRGQHRRAADLRHELLPLERGRRDFAGSDRAGAHHRVDLCKDPRQAGSGVRLCRNEN